MLQLKKDKEREVDELTRIVKEPKDKYENLIDEIFSIANIESQVQAQIAVKLQEQTTFLQKELRNVKNVLRVPRLTEKYREALKQAERKDVLQYFIED